MYYSRTSIKEHSWDSQIVFYHRGCSYMEVIFNINTNSLVLKNMLLYRGCSFIEGSFMKVQLYIQNLYKIYLFLIYLYLFDQY